ncbi:MAG: hypothetical protein ACKPKO_06315, partial [Candidatus Fonsibacter sp.]
MGGVDALVEKDAVQKEWQYVKTLVEAESAEANPKRRMSASRFLATLIIRLGARGLPRPQQPHNRKHQERLLG